MHDFGCSVMSQLKEEDVDQLVAYLDRIYEIAEKEIETRKRCTRKTERGKNE